MTKRDFNFVALLLERFFKQVHIQKRLAFIESEEITSWEIWFQVEFSIFLESQKESNIAWWDREYQYGIDKRKARERTHMAIDFIFRKRHSTLDQYIALEVKQNSSLKSCIRGMMEDTRKVSLVKSSHDDLRSMWTLGIHPYHDEKGLKEIVCEYAEFFDVELASNCIITKPIKKTGLAYTLF